MRLIDADLLTTEIIKISGVIPNFNEDVALCSVDSMPTVRAVSLAEFTCAEAADFAQRPTAGRERKNEIHGAGCQVPGLHYI